MHVITLLLIEWEFISIINCTCYSVAYMGTRPLNMGINRPITLCTVKLFIQLMYNKNDHLAKWSIFCQIFDVFFRLYNPFPSLDPRRPLHIVGHPELEKKILLAFLSTFWHPCSKCILMCFKKDRGGCQVWKCPKVPELGQRSTECKFLYIRQILAFLSISYPKL